MQEYVFAICITDSMSLCSQKYHFQREEVIGRISKGISRGWSSGNERCWRTYTKYKSLFSQMAKAPLQSNCLSMQKIILQKMKDFAKY